MDQQPAKPSRAPVTRTDRATLQVRHALGVAGPPTPLPHPLDAFDRARPAPDFRAFAVPRNHSSRPLLSGARLPALRGEENEPERTTTPPILASPGRSTARTGASRSPRRGARTPPRQGRGRPTSDPPRRSNGAASLGSRPTSWRSRTPTTPVGLSEKAQRGQRLALLQAALRQPTAASTAATERAGVLQQMACATEPGGPRFCSSGSLSCWENARPGSGGAATGRRTGPWQVRAASTRAGRAVARAPRSPWCLRIRSSAKPYMALKAAVVVSSSNRSRMRSAPPGQAAPARPSRWFLMERCSAPA